MAGTVSVLEAKSFAHQQIQRSKVQLSSVSDVISQLDKDVQKLQKSFQLVLDQNQVGAVCLYDLPSGCCCIAELKNVR